MFYYGETLWHKTGKQLKQPTNAEEAISAGGLDGYVKLVPTQKDEALRREITRRMAVVRDDLNSGDPVDPNDDLSEIAAFSGNVFRAIPGGPCLWCTGFLTDERLQEEGGATDRSYLRSSLGKRKKPGPGVHVASFDGVLAGLAASDVLQLILDYSPGVPTRRQYDGFSGTVLEVVVDRNPSCPKCASVLAAGDPLWQ